MLSVCFESKLPKIKFTQTESVFFCALLIIFPLWFIVTDFPIQDYGIFFFWSDLFQWFWFLVAFNSLFRNSKSESVIQSFYTNFVYCNVLVVVSIHQTMCLCFFQHIRLVRSERHLQLQTVVECTHDSLHNADRFETTRNFGYTRMERRLYSIIIVYLWWLKLDKCEQQQYTNKKNNNSSLETRNECESLRLFFSICVWCILANR